MADKKILPEHVSLMRQGIGVTKKSMDDLSDLLDKFELGLITQEKLIEEYDKVYEEVDKLLSDPKFDELNGILM